jgi:hypothetical protein
MRANMSIRVKKSKILIVTIAAFIIVFAVGVFSAFADDEIVPDQNLKNELLAIGADTNGDSLISPEEVAALSGDLNLSGKSISDITGLEHAVGVTSINLQENKIRDIQPLLTLIGTTPHSLTNINISHNYLAIFDGSEDKAIIDQSVASGCAVTFDTQVEIPVTSIALDKESILVGVGETATLTAAFTPDDAANKSLTWSSSNENVATVENGTVSAIGPGQAKITATSVQNSGAAATCTVTVKLTYIESAQYTIDRSQGIVKDVPKMTSLNDFLNNLSNDNPDLIVCDPEGNLCTDTTIKTGMVVKLNVGGVEREALTIIVTGDGNGDGMISVADYTLARLDILGLKPLTGVYRTACDLNADGKISIADYTTMRLDILGIVKSSSPAPDLPVVTDSRIRAFLDVALQQQGKPYVWSNEGPDSFDCSGYVWYCLRQVGYSVGRTTANSYSQKAEWPYVPRDQLQPGDLMFYHSDTRPGIIGHIGIYLGNGYHIHASSDYGRVIICRVDGWYDRMLSHGRRVFN